MVVVKVVAVIVEGEIVIVIVEGEIEAASISTSHRDRSLCIRNSRSIY